MRNALRALVEKILQRPSAEANTDTDSQVTAPSEVPRESTPVDPVEDILSKVHPTDLIRAFFALLLREAPDAKEIWSTFLIVFRDNYEALSMALGRNMERDDLINLLTLFLIPVARNGVF